VTQMQDRWNKRGKKPQTDTKPPEHTHPNFVLFILLVNQIMGVSFNLFRLTVQSGFNFLSCHRATKVLI